VEETWVDNKTSLSEFVDVARCIAGLCAAGTQRCAFRYDGDVNEWKSAGIMPWRTEDGRDGNVHGRAIYITSEDCRDIEENLDLTQKLWLGEKLSLELTTAQDLLKRKN
jgi:hypothetical protein